MPLLHLVVAAIGASCPCLGWYMGAGYNKTVGIFIAKRTSVILWRTWPC